MVFGSVVSANQWEPFLELSRSESDWATLLKSGKSYLDTIAIEWNDDKYGPFQQAKGCAL